MEIIFVILVIIILFLGGYLFFLKRELKRIRKELDFVLSRQTNGLVHTEFVSKEIHDLVDCINTHLIKMKSKESQLARKNANFVKMIRNVSHDLRTPLTSSLGYVSLILESNMNEQDRVKNLKIVEERFKRLSELIDSFFEFSKVLSHDQIIELDEINLVAVMEKAISNYYEDFSKEGRTINFYTDRRHIKLKSNEVMLVRVFDNLIFNAYKHSEGYLDIEIQQYDDKVVLKFQNDLQYNDLDVERIFDEFYTVDISRTKGNTGLGLAIVKEFVEELNGTIEARKENRTLIFLITFML